MTDRELLEKAARACGYNVEGSYQDDDDVTFLHLNPRPSERVGWSSLADSGDCAEMNAELRLHTEWTDHDDPTVAVWCLDFTMHHPAKLKDHNNDRSAAWRYASTVVAGMIGERK